MIHEILNEQKELDALTSATFSHALTSASAGIKEGHRPGIEDKFIEEWHQKLHTNCAPDDIVIAEAYIKSLSLSLSLSLTHSLARSLSLSLCAAYRDNLQPLNPNP